TNVLTSGTNAATGTISASAATGWVVGNVKRFVTNATTSRTFEVGTASQYAPLTVTFPSGLTGTSDSGTNPSFFIGSATAGEHPQVVTSGISPSKDVNIYWSLASGGGGSVLAAGYTVKAEFPTAAVDPGANTNAFIIQRFQGGAWNLT